MQGVDVMNELRSCPFCGSNEIDLFEYDPYDGYQGNCTSWVIQCKGCHVRIARTDKKQVQKAWNERAYILKIPVKKKEGK